MAVETPNAQVTPDSLADSAFAPGPEATPAPALAPAAETVVPTLDTEQQATPSAQPRNPDGTFAPDTPAPPKRVIKIKVDDQESEVDLDAEFADEQRREALARDIQKGRAFESATERAQRRGAAETAKEMLTLLRDQGYDLYRDPATGQISVVPPQAAQNQRPAEKPEPNTTDIAALREKARGGGADDVIAYSEALANQRAAEVERRLKAERDAERSEADLQARHTAYQKQFATTLQPVVNEIAADLGDTPETRGLIYQQAAAYFNAGMAPENARAALAAFRDSIRNVKRAATPAAPVRKPAAPPPAMLSVGGAVANAGHTKTKYKSPDELADAMFRVG